jgi:tetratricopeptide (TPR) repeat protein
MMSRLLACIALLVAIATPVGRGFIPRQSPAPDREAGYRSNNLGVALLEQYQYESAATAFRDALRIDPGLMLARLNLAIALYYVPDLPAAAREATEAARALPAAPQPSYILGLIARAENREADAARLFERVRELAPRDTGAAINLAQIYLQQRKYAEAIAVLQPAVADEPYNVTAAYNLGLALTRAGNAEEGRQMMERSQALRTTGYGTTLSNTYLEQGRYAEAVASTGAEPDLVDAAPPRLTFSSGPLAQMTTSGDEGGCVAMFDADGDGDLDLFVARPSAQRLFRNDGRGSFTDVSAASNLTEAPASSVPRACVAGDVDNDGLPDLFVLRSGKSSLYRNGAGARFTDIGGPAGIPDAIASPTAAALADVDHDGDLDIVIAPLALLRNNGNGTFTDITRAAALPGGSRAIAIVPTDFDNHRDLDLLIVSSSAAPALFKNMRDGTFKDVAGDVGLAEAFSPGSNEITCVATADVNKDDYPDFFFGRSGAPGLLALSDGTGRYRVLPLPEAGTSASAAQLFDYDNDGLIDAVTWTRGGMHVARNIGKEWMDLTSTAVPSALPSPAAAESVVTADVDSDGDLDVVVLPARGGPAAIRNSGDSRNHFVRVQLKGRVSNRSGIGSKVQIRAGSLTQRLETSAASPAVAPADVVFGIGRRTGAEVVRVLWPSGTVQAETGKPLAASTAVEELDRKPSSCPFLFTWNGERFEFVTDFMGGGEMGYWEGPGRRNVPDPLEYVRIDGAQLKAKDGRYEIRVTNELEETLFADRLQLMSVAHPADVEVYPDEGMTDPPKRFRLFGVRDIAAPVSAIDDHGRDVAARVARLDRLSPDDFEVKQFRGYAAEHALVLDIGARVRPLLLLTGWTDYAFSSDNVAATQAGLSLSAPSLQVRSADGAWRTEVPDIGIPVGRPQTIVVDLSGHLRAGEHQVRLVTNMRIYWDQVRIGTKIDISPFETATMPPVRAELRERGFSAELKPDGREPVTYDYARVSTDSPWKTMAGRYTRTGDVRALLARSDDMFVIAKPGDEISLSFDATAQPVRDGWTRTFLLVADGFSKEMDINSASPDVVEPLPFHGMTRYPYAENEKYPDTPPYREYRAQYNTRPAGRPWAIAHR